MAAKYCTQCGVNLLPWNNICPKCGEPRYVEPSEHNTITPGNVSKKNPKTKIITETRHTCNVCGNVWHYGKQEQLQNVGNAMSNAGKGMMCCTGCVPAVFIPDKKVVDLNKCPSCGSKNIRKEQIAHAVPK